MRPFRSFCVAFRTPAGDGSITDDAFSGFTRDGLRAEVRLFLNLVKSVLGSTDFR